MQPIDGNEPFGIDYSADLCAVANPLASTKCVSGMPWADNVAEAGNHVPCWQFYSNITTDKKTCVRINTKTDSIWGDGMYVFDDYFVKSLHFEFSKLFINGVDMGSGSSSGMAGGSTFNLAAGTMFYSYRLYNRKLSIEEQKYNYALDKQRFGVVDI